MSKPEARWTTLSVCSGVGGLDYGLHHAGLRTVGFCEFEDYPQQVLSRHFGAGQAGGPALWRDLIELGAQVAEHGPQGVLEACEVDQIDVLQGGIPCQPNSVAGSRLGTADPRWLWPSMRQLEQKLAPKLVLIENVRGLLTANGGWALGSIFRDLLTDGYDVEWELLSAGALGAPHIRHRLFIVGVRRDLGVTVFAQEEAGRPLGRWDGRRERRLASGAVKVTGKPTWAFSWPKSGRLAVDAAGGIKLWERTPRWPDPARVEGATAWPWLQRAAEVLPTPRASDGRKKGGAGGKMISLETTMKRRAIRGMLPTPTAAEGNGAGHAAEGGMNLRTVALQMLPTPAAGCFNDSEDPEQWLARRERLKATSDAGNGAGIPLAVAVKMMLPTPAAADGERASETMMRGNPTLLGAARSMLPTPSTVGEVGRGYHRSGGKAFLALPGAVGGGAIPDELQPQASEIQQGLSAAMIPTPTTRDWKDGASSEANVEENALLGRWAWRAGPGRLLPEPVEWMMGWPHDWTAPAGASLLEEGPRPWTGWPQLAWVGEGDEHRRSRLKATGNGVVSVQAFVVGECLVEALARCDRAVLALAEAKSNKRWAPEALRETRTCTKCGHEGPLVADFGLRDCKAVRKDGSVEVVVRSQPQCRPCRGGGRGTKKS